MRTRVVRSSTSPSSPHLWRFAVRDGRMVVGDFLFHRDLIRAAYGTLNVTPTTYGRLSTDSCGDVLRVTFEGMNGKGHEAPLKDDAIRIELMRLGKQGWFVD